MFFNYNGIKIEINNRRKFEKFTNTNSLQRINESKKRNHNKISKYLEISGNENTTHQINGMQVKQCSERS